MDYDAARFWFDILQSVFMFAVAIYVWWGNRRRVTRQAIDAVNERIREVETRALILEKYIETLPTNKERNNELGEIHHRVDEVGQGLTRLEGQMGQLNSQLSLIHSYLLKERP